MPNGKVIEQTDADQILRGVRVPSRPSVLVEIDRELQKDDVNLAAVASRIATDVGLSSAMLRAVNSPFFGLRSKIGSIAQAVQVLGVRNVRSLVTGLMLRSSVGGSDPWLVAFWDASERVARISAFIAAKTPRGPRDEAYTFGLFRDCARPLLLQRFPTYRDTLTIPTTEFCSPTQIEEAHLETNHAVVGQFVAIHWGLPEAISDAIQRHHDITVFDEGDPIAPLALKLIAINFLAEHLQQVTDSEWQRVGHFVMDHLRLDGEDLDELTQEVEALGD